MRTRYRIQSRWFGPPLIVLQVEVEMWRPHQGAQPLMRWRDARMEDFLTDGELGATIPPTGGSAVSKPRVPGQPLPPPPRGNFPSCGPECSDWCYLRGTADLERMRQGREKHVLLDGVWLTPEEALASPKGIAHVIIRKPERPTR